jgi:hypothetical protein
MLETAKTPEDLNHEDKARLVLDMFHRIIVHYGLWFAEILLKYWATRRKEVMLIR